MHKQSALGMISIISLMVAGCGSVSLDEPLQEPAPHEVDLVLEEEWLPEDPLDDLTRDETQDEELQQALESAWSDYRGLSQQDAVALAQSRWQAYRIVMLEWIPQKVSLDTHPDRVNFSIEEGMVVDVSFG